MEFVETGIEGVDSILNGGIVANATVLVSGNPGTGKSIFGIEYLYNGARDHGEKGIYLSFEENEEDIGNAASSIGFEEWEALVDRGDIAIFDKRQLLRENDFSSTLDRILDDLQDSEYERLVMDTLTMFQLFFETEREQRRYLLKFSDILKANGFTSLLISEQGSVFPDTDVGLENFLTDGNIYLFQTPTDSGVNRYIWIAKMRRQDIENDIFPIEIGQGGITVHDGAAGFSLMDGSSPPFE